jgi:hypothetical protein
MPGCRNENSGIETPQFVTLHRPVMTTMDFDQGEFNFDAKGSEDGYRKWREELDAKKRAFESRWGVILRRRVCVSLRDHAKPLTGILEWVNERKKGSATVPVLRLRGLEFSPSEIESIVQVEGS